MAATHDVIDMLGSSPMKKRRGRPSLKKNLSGGKIGESTMPIALNSLNQQSAHELSEATVKQGFCSTPVMRLSPSKDSRLGGGGGKTATKTKSKSVLYEINNSAGMVSGGSKKPRKTYSEPCFVNSTVGGKSDAAAMATATPQKASKTSTMNPSTLSSSSPLSSNLLTSDPIHQSSSPLQTSPLPSEYGFNKNIANGKNHTMSNHHNGNTLASEINLKNAGLEEKPAFSVQSSPFYNSASKNYDDQIFKYINSSPISTAHTPRRRGFDQNLSLDSVMRLQRSTNGRVGKYSALTTPMASPQRPYRQQQQLQHQQYKYRLSYRYKLTLDIDDYGKAKIYARVIENNVFSPPGSRHYDPYQRPLEECATSPYGRMLADDGGVSASASDSDMDNFEPSRYEQYLNEQRRYNEQRQQIIRNSMKSDPYMTEYYTPIEYISAANSPVQRARSSRPQTSHSYGHSHGLGPSTGRHLLHGQPGGFEDYINQEYERVKTVDMTYVVNNSYAAAKGLSAGIDVDATASAVVPGMAVYDQPAVRDELSRLSQFRRLDKMTTANLDRISESRESGGGGGNSGNDAMTALRHAVLSCEGFAR